MKQTIAIVRERTSSWDRRLPIVIGGAPVDQTASDQVGAYVWCDEGASGLKIVRALVAPPSRRRAREAYSRKGVRVAADSGSPPCQA